MNAWSYSSIKTFEQCPKKYYHLKVLKDVKDVGSAASIYGNMVHKAAEDYIKDGTEIPEKYAFLRPVVEAFEKIPGDKHCELRLGVAFDGENYAPTTFFGKDVWWRGIIDLLIVDGEKAYIIDYKTGKNVKYADTKQLDLMAGAVFIHYPEVETIKSALAFVVTNDFIKKDHKKELALSYMNTFDPLLVRLVAAEENNVWNAVSSPLCAYCPVTKCEHNRGR